MADTVRASIEIVAQLRGSGTVLTDADRRAAASTIGVTLQKILAVETVESRGRGFRQDEANPALAPRPVILFEPHVFSRRTGRRFDADYSDVSYPTWGTEPYPSSQTARWAQLAKAARLDEAAALNSTSWGLFQIIGYNFAAAGYLSVQAFARDMATTEGAQLAAFARFLKANPAMQKALQLSDWAGFARLYNGPSYAQHGYDQKLKAAYAAAIAAQAAADRAKATA